MLLCLLTILSTPLNPVQDLKKPESKLEEHRKYHLPAVTGSSSAIRSAAYEQRLKLEADSDWSQVKWRSVGPEIQSGRVIDIEVPANDPKRMYVAFATGGLWVTSDAGNSWTPLMDQESAFAIGDTAVSKDGNTIWVGTGERNSQRTSYAGSGIFKSSDSGKTWRNMGLQESHRIGKVLIDPRNENTVYVGAIGALYSQNPNRGVYKTTDGGKTWQWVLKLNEYTGVIDMQMDPRNPQVIYAAAWERDRRAWNFREGGPGTAIYKTSDGGKNWAKLTKGLPGDEQMGRIALALAPSKPDTIYAFIDNQGVDPDTLNYDEFTPSGILTPKRYKLLNQEQFLALDAKVLEAFFARYTPQATKMDEVIGKLKAGTMSLADLDKEIEKRVPGALTYEQALAQVYRSDDAGKTWKRTHIGQLGDHGGYYWNRAFVSPHDPNDIMTTGLFILRSKDGGKTWFNTSAGMHVDHHAVWFDPNDPQRIAVGNDGGLYFSFDDGKKWRHINEMSVGQFTTIAVDNKSPYNIMGGLQDNGTLLGPSTYVPGRSQKTLWQGVGGGDGSAVAFDWRDNDIIYVASQFGAHSARNLKTNERWQIRPRTRPGDPPLRFNWVSPLIVSSHHPDILYLGSQKVHRSLDKGRTWEDISPDLTKNMPNGDVPFSTLTHLSESPLKFGLLYAGADDGSLKVSKDGGSTWTDISTPAKDRWITRVIASKWDVGTVYVAQNGYRQDQWDAILWKSTDYGKTWQSIAGNLPAEPINVIREDPNRNGVLYVGTDLGVFMSSSGSNWIPLHGGLPRTPVHDLAIQAREDELVIGTHARSVWILSLKPIFDTPADVRSKDLGLWAFEDMRRDPQWEYRRRTDWDVSNAPAPIVRGQMWSSQAGKAMISIKDKDGKVVKSKAFNAAKGLNYVEIDLELSPAKRWTVDARGRKIEKPEDALKDPFEAERPKYLPAGDYKIEVTVNGKTASVDWKLT